jgi:hypothetical protein
LLQVPVATHTGWNLRAPGHGEGELFSIIGSMILLARTAEERRGTGDPRPSLEERYGSRDGWARQLAEAADRLVQQRYFLAEDAERLVAAARRSWDVFAVV